MKRNFRKIGSPKDLRRVLSDVINKLLADEIDTPTAQAISSACNVMLKILQASAIESRLTRLELMLNSETGIDNKPKALKPVTSDIPGMINRIKDETANTKESMG